MMFCLCGEGCWYWTLPLALLKDLMMIWLIYSFLLLSALCRLAGAHYFSICNFLLVKPLWQSCVFWIIGKWWGWSDRSVCNSPQNSWGSFVLFFHCTFLKFFFFFSFVLMILLLLQIHSSFCSSQFDVVMDLLAGMKSSANITLLKTRFACLQTLLIQALMVGLLFYTFDRPFRLKTLL